jgi:hypothetical protein
LILLSLSLERCITVRFPSRKLDLPQIYHSSKNPSKDLGIAINLFVVEVNVNVTSSRNIGVTELLSSILQTSRFFVNYGTNEVPKRMPSRSPFDVLDPCGFERRIDSALPQGIRIDGRPIRMAEAWRIQYQNPRCTPGDEASSEG